MRTIAFVTQKGGSGKSTLASCVAVAAREAGEKVFIIDMDALGSLIKWSTARGETDIPVEAVPTPKLKQVLSALEKKGFTLAVIDTPGAETEAMTAAVKAADLCVIPARPNAFDLWASEKTRATIKDSGREFAFLLNQCPPAQQSARVEMGAKALEAMGGLLTPLVQARVDYQEAARMGRGVTELASHSLAADEMRALWSSIKRRMNRISNANKKAAAKIDSKAEIKNEVKSETKADSKIEAKADLKSDLKTTSKTDSKTEAKSDAKDSAPAETKASLKAAAKSAKTNAKSDQKAIRTKAA